MHVWRDFWLAYGVIAGKIGGRPRQIRPYVYDTKPNHHYTAGCVLSNSHSGRFKLRHILRRIVYQSGLQQTRHTLL